LKIFGPGLIAAVIEGAANFSLAPPIAMHQAAGHPAVARRSECERCGDRRPAEQDRQQCAEKSSLFIPARHNVTCSRPERTKALTSSPITGSALYRFRLPVLCGRRFLLRLTVRRPSFTREGHRFGGRDIERPIARLIDRLGLFGCDWGLLLFFFSLFLLLPRLLRLTQYRKREGDRQQ
jgi:hypothetical protein